MKHIIGVMGPGEQATELDRLIAYQLGALIAQQGWLLLTGGRNVGVMDAASRGAKQANGLTIGILPSADAADVSDAIDIVIPTGMGNARNVINVLASHVVMACGMGSGTASEVALALKTDRPVILLNANSSSQAFFQALSGEIRIAQSAEEAIEQAQRLLGRVIH
jgi:uncharacterized protein (TIGR00725 family)